MGGSCICNFEHECHLLQDHPDKFHAFSYHLEELCAFVEVLPGLRLVSSGAALFLCKPDYSLFGPTFAMSIRIYGKPYGRQFSCQLFQALQRSDQSLNFNAVYGLKRITIDLTLDVLNIYLASVDAFATFYEREI